MARVTVEDCLEKVGDQFALVHLSTKRFRQLRRGAPRLYNCPKNKDKVKDQKKKKREVSDFGVCDSDDSADDFGNYH